MTKDDGNVIELTDFKIEQVDPPQEAASPPPPQDEKIIVFQLVTPTMCNFLCLSADETNQKFEIGIMRR